MTKWLTIQKMYSEMNLTSYADIYHDVTPFQVDGIV